MARSTRSGLVTTLPIPVIRAGRIASKKNFIGVGELARPPSSPVAGHASGSDIAGRKVRPADNSTSSQLANFSQFHLLLACLS
ncbi:MAG: hypothetical protein GY837_28120 [Bosea sp.]|uniref:hypothetical protein n=1 Tax=Bosea sp. (in: a-proteobacteria) TaxID=1871050 RepID=UPI0031FEDD97|nr:hypothetical protein [Bosea sp. (in: a-proteobacteria)]